MNKRQLSILFFLILEAATLVFGTLTLCVFIAVAYAGFLLLMALRIDLNFYVNSQNKTSTDDVLLTFDDGPDENLTPKILDVLQKKNVKARFFVIGKNISGNEEIIKRIIDEGHELGGHTQSHPWNFALMNQKKVENEILQGLQKIEAITGKPCKHFRPPVGVTNPIIAKVLKKHQIKSVGWSLRSLDTIARNGEKLLSRVVRKVKVGDMVLFHDTQKTTLEILPQFINAARAKGITFVSPKSNKA